MKFEQKLSEIIATFFYVGKIKFAPGTFGSLMAFPLSYSLLLFPGIKNFFKGYYVGVQQLYDLYYFVFINSFAAVFLFIIGVYYSSKYVKYKGVEDPKEVVIDEVVGQLLTFTFSFITIGMVYYTKIIEIFSPIIIDFIFMFLLPFALFRFYDILKPWPINVLDKRVKGGFGIMIDDVIAALFAVVTYYAIVLVLVDWFKFS